MELQINQERVEDLTKQATQIAESPKFDLIRPHEKAETIIGLSRAALGIEPTIDIFDIKEADRHELLFVMRAVRDLTSPES